ncbi:protein YgfX [Alkalilimnicola sp. S0819]|uniref:protein YgfX n=1 Tax=Alkalilimnicola sp. S0819 TaxID=2613922 RepID=UPI001262979B|nr:protein YgfX [Alkalilimnicola sp. S0819]KAB7627550.1 hypothetical protein F3N43_03560 [Alkalilimnicola sp. S0819]MPQ15706.1 hypothetical protein [Alkalilimnicola sp. S0819]
MLPWVARLPASVSLLWSALILGLAAEALWALHRRRRYLPRAIALAASGAVRLRWGDRQVAAKHAIASGFRHPAVCLIRLRGAGGRRSLVLPRDCLGDHAHRRLRVYLTAWSQARATPRRPDC